MSEKWNGEGEPQQFEDIQIKQNDGSWVEGVYLCRHDGAAIVATQRPDDGFNYFWIYWGHIRPIRSAEEVAVEAMESVFSNLNDGTYHGGLTAIYAAIRDGKIPGVKLED